MTAFGLRIREGADYDVVQPGHGAFFEEHFDEFWQAYHRLTERKGVSPDYARREIRRRATLFGALMAVKFSSFAEMPANFWGFLFCGVLWGFSFIIPGMTSSSILMAVGLLTPLIDGIAQLDFTVLVPWGLGMVGVMALFARIVSRLFDTHYSIACHAVIGIVLASTLIIIPTDFASTAEMVWSVACAILGAVLAYFGSKLQPQEDAEIEAK